MYPAVSSKGFTLPPEVTSHVIKPKLELPLKTSHVNKPNLPLPPLDNRR